jgi:dipeptidyl aminopeptidase/acylaminoacyl peptidase
MSEVKTEDVSFHGAAGVEVAGKYYLPPEGQGHGTGVVMCHGFGGIKEGVLPGLAQLLAQAGYTALTFDFRGFGGTGGPVGRLVPDEQVEDTVHALEFIAGEGRVDPDRIGLYGTSFGGGIAAMAAAFSDRPKALAVSVPVTSGHGWLKSMTRYAEFRELKARAMKAIREKTLTGRMEMVDRFDIMIPDRLTLERYTQKIPMALETFYHVLHHEPIARATDIAVPTLMFGVETDQLVPVSQTTDFYDRLTVEKAIDLSDHGTHWAVYDELLPIVSKKAVGWFDRHLRNLDRA